jgi:hypothetical protein
MFDENMAAHRLAGVGKRLDLAGKMHIVGLSLSILR